MDHFETIYTRRAADYHRMIAAEDVDGNLPAALSELGRPRGKRILDLGSGTGRIPLLLGSQAAQMVAVDLQRAMLLEQRRQKVLAREKELAGLKEIGGKKEPSDADWSLVQADMRHIALVSGWAQLTLAGWAIGHLRTWFSQDWQRQMRITLAEMQRVTQPGGRLVIIETLGTGSLVPKPPVESLAEYYTWLEQDWGFWRHEIRTDYQFDSVEQAVAHTQFFFGSELADKIRANRWRRVPEWTGIWTRDNT
jgi:ubiquinone/menaquinone biosynthesis C-methylase UbiE